MKRSLNRALEAKLSAVASHGLAPLDVDGPGTVVSDGEAEEFVQAVREHRISGVAVVALIDGALVVSDETAALLVALHDEIMGQTMRTEITATQVSDLLTEAAIDHRVLKGLALAHTVYLDPAARSFRDVDVLVPSDDIDETVERLMVLGATRAQPELRPGYDRRFSKSVTLRLDGVEVDVHRILCPGPFGVWMKPNDLFVLRSVVAIAGVDIPILDRTDNLLHACYHVALGQVEPVLSNLRDIVELAGAEDEIGFDAERFDQTVDRWQGTAVIRRAVRLVEQRLKAPLPEALRSYANASVDKTHFHALEPYLVEQDGSRFGALAPATLRALPLADRAAYALAVGLPEGTEPIDRIKGLLNRS